MNVPHRWIEAMRAGEALVLAQVDGLADDDLAGPSRLPGWDRAHVVGHLARNADALGNLLAWARTGIPTPMYPSADARAGGIEESARQGPAALRADVGAASARLVAAVGALPEAAWDGEIRTNSGRRVTGAEVPWMRVRETWVHAVDLGTGVTFDDVLPEVVDALVDEVAGGLAGRDDCPAATLTATDRPGTWSVGPAGTGATAVGGDGLAVSGRRADLCAWLLGRDDGSRLDSSAPDGRAPALPRWL
jgi:maleylpyruvate isomerase